MSKCMPMLFFPPLKLHWKVVLGCSSWIASLPHQISSHSVEKCARRWNRKVLLYADHLTPSQGHGHRKRYTMVEVNCACEHGRYERFWLKRLHAMSNIKGFAMQVGRTDTLLTWIKKKTTKTNKQKTKTKKDRCEGGSVGGRETRNEHV